MVGMTKKGMTGKRPMKAAMVKDLDMDGMKKGGKVKGYKSGGSVDGCAIKGKTRGKMV
jgi:hypothetical protein